MATEHKNLAELRQILTGNKANWHADETSISKLPVTQRRYRLGYSPGPGQPTLAEREQMSLARAEEARGLAAAVSTSIDWRNVNGRNFISSIKDQGSCGSCVAFGVAATVEAAARVTVNLAVNDTGGGTLPDLSEAQLFYCGGSSQGRNCSNGWWPDAALAYCSNPGLAPWSCFPYSAGDQPCNLCSNWQTMVTTVGGYHDITSVAAMKQWLLTRGALTTCFTVYADFYNYSSGVYTHQSGGVEGGHCVCCIGFDDNLQAWLCKNSWGTGWGMSGYFWIGYGQCGIDSVMNAVDSFGKIYPLYNDLFLRDNLDDGGSVPAAGTLSSSPDIIPFGTAPVSDPATFFTNNYGNDVGQDLVANSQNYIYMRAKNLSLSGGENGTLSLYYSPASLLLYPSLWQNNILKTGSGATTVPVSAAATGDIVVGTDPFTWQPQMISGDHYCLIGQIVTASHPNPIPQTGGIQDFATYIANNRGMGWRNVSIVNNGSPTFTQTVQYNQGNEQGDMAILITCSNVPVGAEVAFSCGTPGPNPPINLPRTKVTNSSSFVVGITSVIPANFNSSIAYSYWANGTVPLPNWSIGLSVVYFVPSSNSLYKHGKTFEELGLKEHEHKHVFKETIGIGPTKGIIVGGHLTRGY